MAVAAAAVVVEAFAAKMGHLEDNCLPLSLC